MQKSGWLYVAITKKARALASVPLIVERQKRDGKWEPDPKHPAQKLLNSPNPHMDTQGMIERWAQHMELAGNAVWHKVRSGQGVTLELWPVLPDKIRPIPSRRDYLAGYEFRPTPHDRLTLTPDEIIHWQYQDPRNTYWGLAPIRAAAQTIDADIAALVWNRNVLANGARPAGVISLSHEMSIEQWEAARAMIQAQTGGAGNARQFLAFGGATRVDSFGFDATDMDFLNGRRLNREEIFSVIGVPAILAVQGEGSTYANMEAAKRSFWEDTLIPLLDDLCRTLTASLLTEFGGAERHRIRADLSSVPALRENEEQRAKVALTLTQAGYSPESVATHLQLPLEVSTKPQEAQEEEEAVSALKSLSPPAVGWVERQTGREVKSLSPPDALRVARALASADPARALSELKWENYE